MVFKAFLLPLAFLLQLTPSYAQAEAGTACQGNCQASVIDTSHLQVVKESANLAGEYFKLNKELKNRFMGVGSFYCKGEYFATGFLTRINGKDLVITAAHNFIKSETSDTTEAAEEGTNDYHSASDCQYVILQEIEGKIYVKDRMPFKEIHIHRDFEIAKYNSDIAVVELAAPAPGYIYPLQIDVFPSSNYDKTILSIGYHSYLGEAKKYLTKGLAFVPAGTSFRHWIRHLGHCAEVGPGNSGSPVLATDGTAIALSTHLIGRKSGDPCNADANYNGAVLFDYELLEWFESIANSN